MKLALGLMLACSLSAAEPSPTLSPMRDLAAYSTLGPFLIPLAGKMLSVDDHVLIASQIRQFVVDCWQHHRGRLITVNFTTEGFPIRSTYFIEPDSTGKWRIAIETVATLPGTKPSGEHYTEQRTDLGTLEISNTSDGRKHVRIVSGGKTLKDL